MTRERRVDQPLVDQLDTRVATACRARRRPRAAPAPPALVVPSLAGGVMAVALAFAAAAVAVVGAWEVLAAVERTRVAALLARAVAPVVRAGTRGVAPTAPERRRLAVLAAGALAAAGWLLGGVRSRCSPRSPGRCSRPRSCGRGGGGSAARSPRRRRPSPGRSPTRCRPGTRCAARSRWSRPACPGAAGHELRAGDRARLGAPTEAVLERLRRRAASPAWDAMVAGILLQRDAGGDLPALLRDLARRSRPPPARTATRSPRPPRRASPRGSCSCCRSAPRCSPSSRSPGFLAGLLADPVSAVLACLALPSRSSPSAQSPASPGA